ncbi:MAG: S8/S53 family peptidase [Ferruginibacter sp.]
MKKVFTLTILAAIILLQACKKTASEKITPANPSVISSAKIDDFIREEIRTKQNFEWATASDEMVWSALQQSDKILSVGYRPANENKVEDRLAEIDIRSNNWKAARQQVLSIILTEESKTQSGLEAEALEVWSENVLPVMDVRVENLSTIKALRASNLVRYAEPMGYEPQSHQSTQAVQGSSGCGSNTFTAGLVAGVDYLNITPNSKQSWNYAYHNIPGAWTKTTGAGVKVFFIDTGAENDQENLGSAFNQGSSSGRTIEKIVTLPRQTLFGFPIGSVETPDDGCGHGTSMAGACAAPRGTDGAACGVAYNCNLVVSRASSDVFLDESREVKGVSDAYTNAANRSDVKVISMSMGRISSSSQMSDAIKYAYGKGKLMFVAAGTSFSWASSWFGVVFPATLSEVNAVTGVRDNNFNTQCSDCHDGSQTDFTVVMEKAASGMHPITLANTGDAPSTVGGSSVATATSAGIAALVWSRFPAYTRDQVLNRMIQSSSRYPTKSSNLGWGNVNADLATN